MSEILLAGTYWMHLIATVVWIGGITFLLFVVIPSANQALGAEAGRLMGEVSKRFAPIVNYSMVLLFATGIVLTAVNKQFSGIGNFVNDWYLGLIVKHVFVSGMVAVHFYRGLILASKMKKAKTSSEKASLQKLSLNLVRVNFYLGLMVLLLSGITTIQN